MSIDWITVIAQIANFLVLIWLLKRFLYRPILAGIDAREAEIAKRMQAADQAKAEATAAKEHYQSEYAAHLAERETLVDKALQSTEAERAKLIQDGRKQLQQEQENWQHFLQQEKQAFYKQLSQEASRTLYQLMDKALHELADSELEQAIAQHLVKQLGQIQSELIQAAGAEPKVQVSSTWPLLPATQNSLTQAIQALLPNAQLEFSHAPDNALGVELKLGGAQVSWTLESYINSLNASLEQHG